MNFDLSFRTTTDSCQNFISKVTEVIVSNRSGPITGRLYYRSHPGDNFEEADDEESTGEEMETSEEDM